VSNPLTHDFGLTHASTGGSDDRWLRIGHDAHNALSYTLDVAAFLPYVDEWGFLPSGVGIHFDAARNLAVPFVEATAGHVLVGFTKVQYQLKVGDRVLTKCSAAIIQTGTIDRKFLPIAAQRTIDRDTQTDGQFVFTNY
jgi:hypothetical protein